MSQTQAVAPEGRVFEKVIDGLRSQLTAGELKPGDRLPSERELAEWYGVSRASLREALRTLEVLGILEIRPKLGTYVRHPDSHALASVLGLTVLLQGKTADEVLEARTAVECQAIRLACQRSTEDDLIAIKGALDTVHRELASTDRGADTDFEFHSAIVRASHSAVLLLIYDSLETLLRKSHYERRAAMLDDPEFLSTLGEAHTALYLAVAARDEQTAEEEMRRHYRLVQLFQEKTQSREEVAAPR